MVTIAKIKQLIVLPTEFVSSWEGVGDHKDINGYLAADLSKCTNFNLNFHGAASTWLMQTFNPEKIGTDETIIAKCTSKIEKMNQISKPIWMSTKKMKQKISVRVHPQSK